MKFIVIRTSLGSSDDASPCQDAEVCIRAPDPLWDDKEIILWSVEIDTVQDMVDFVSKYGRVVVHPPGDYDWKFGEFGKDMNLIEIYDYYRE